MKKFIPQDSGGIHANALMSTLLFSDIYQMPGKLKAPNITSGSNDLFI